MDNKTIFTIIIILCLIYLMFFCDKIEGMEDQKDGFFDILLGYFYQNKTKKCNTDFDKSLYKIEDNSSDERSQFLNFNFDFYDIVEITFNNFSNNECKITISNIIDYGFSDEVVNRFKDEFKKEEIEKGDIDDLMINIKRTRDYRYDEYNEKNIETFTNFVEGMSNSNSNSNSPQMSVKKYNEEDQEKIINDTLTGIYFASALGKTKLTLDDFNDNLGLYASTNTMLSMIYSLTSFYWEAKNEFFMLFSENKKSIENSKAFVNALMSKKAIFEYYDKHAETILSMIDNVSNKMGKNDKNMKMNKISNLEKEELRNILSSSLDELFGENNDKMRLKDILKKIQVENQRGYEMMMKEEKEMMRKKEERMMKEEKEDYNPEECDVILRNVNEDNIKDNLEDTIEYFLDCGCDINNIDHSMPECNDVLEHIENEFVNKSNNSEPLCLTKNMTNTDSLWCLLYCNENNGECDSDPNTGCENKCESKVNRVTRTESSIAKDGTTTQTEWCSQFTIREGTETDPYWGDICEWGILTDSEKTNGRCLNKDDDYISEFYCKHFINEYECGIAQERSNEYELPFCEWESDNTQI